VIINFNRTLLIWCRFRWAGF